MRGIAGTAGAAPLKRKFLHTTAVKFAPRTLAERKHWPNGGNCRYDATGYVTLPATWSIASVPFDERLSMSELPSPEYDEPMAGPLLPMLYNIVYSSRAAPGVDAADVQRIVATARRHNPRNGISGLLVFGSGVFLQWLEGPRDRVRDLMARLHADARHDTLVVISETEECRERLFPDWDMELVSADDIHAVLLDALDQVPEPNGASALRALIARVDTGSVSG